MLQNCSFCCQMTVSIHIPPIKINDWAKIIASSDINHLIITSDVVVPQFHKHGGCIIWRSSFFHFSQKRSDAEKPILRRVFLISPGDKIRDIKWNSRQVFIVLPMEYYHAFKSMMCPTAGKKDNVRSKIWSGTYKVGLLNLRLLGKHWLLREAQDLQVPLLFISKDICTYRDCTQHKGILELNIGLGRSFEAPKGTLWKKTEILEFPKM